MEIKKINGYKILINVVLGSGSFGTVYKGIQNETKAECAIKIVERKKISKDPYLKSAMDNEIQIMSKLKSVNVVGFFDVLVSDNNYYIVQELCDSDLERYLTQHKQKGIEQKTGVEFLTQICNGFLTLIKQGIVHRDLKPANILISKGVLKIGDFGFAKANAHRKVVNQSAVGTPLYMSQEVLKSKNYTSKCDIWSIGCIFYEILHGRTPWVAKSECQLYQNIMTQPLLIDPKLSENTKSFLVQTLKVREEERICWDDLFKHPIFNGYFDKFISENIELENKYLKVMSDLRFQINSENIDLQSLWGNLGFEETKDIKFPQFQEFLEEINPNMIEWEQRYFFEKLDPQGVGSISLSYLCKQLQKYSISTTSRYKNKIPLNIKKINTLNEQFQEMEPRSSNKKVWDEQFEQRVRACFQKMHKILTNKGITLSKTFVIYDKDSSGQLSIDEFARIMKKLDPSFTAEETQSVFDLIDEDGSKSIKFEELNNYYCKINGIPAKMNAKGREGSKEEKQNGGWG